MARPSGALGGGPTYLYPARKPSEITSVGRTETYIFLCALTVGFGQDHCTLSDCPIGLPSGVAAPPAWSRPGSNGSPTRSGNVQFLAHFDSGMASG